MRKAPGPATPEFHPGPGIRGLFAFMATGIAWRDQRSPVEMTFSTACATGAVRR